VKAEQAGYHVVLFAGMACFLGPTAWLSFGPPPLWMRSVVAIVAGIACGLIWRLVKWPSGWGACRDFFGWSMMFQPVLGVLGLIAAAIAAATQR
jgi:hypothetical protein